MKAAGALRRSRRGKPGSRDWRGRVSLQGFQYRLTGCRSDGDRTDLGGISPGRVTHDRRDHRGLQVMANPDVCHAVRCAMILNGVDICTLHGWTSAVHTEVDVERTVRAFEKALLLLPEDGLFS